MDNPKMHNNSSQNLTFKKKIKESYKKCNKMIQACCTELIYYALLFPIICSYCME